MADAGERYEEVVKQVWQNWVDNQRTATWSNGEEHVIATKISTFQLVLDAAYAGFNFAMTEVKKMVHDDDSYRNHEHEREELKQRLRNANG